VAWLVAAAAKSADGSTAEGSVIRYNQRTGQVEKIGGGQQQASIAVGETRRGFKYNGGDPTDPNNWSKV